MWNSCVKFARLKKALKYCGLNPKRLDLDDLARVFKKRGITDRKQNRIIYSVLDILEPPGCPVSHCRHYGGQSAFCDCGAGLIPNKCGINRDYFKHRRERVMKATDELLALIKEHDKEDILPKLNIRLEAYVFFDRLEDRFIKLKMSITKWRPLHEDMWREIKKRAKEVQTAKMEKE